MRTHSRMAIVTAVVLAAACGRETNRTPLGPSSAITVAPGFGTSNQPLGSTSVSWSCFTNTAVSHGAFGAAGCPSTRVTTSRFLPATTGAAVTAPSAPANLTATVTGTSVALNWTAPAGGDPPTSYTVQAGSASGLSDLANFDTGSTATTLVVLGVPNGTYFVRIHANNAAGQSGASNEFQLVVGTGGTPCGVPGAPTGLTASVTGNTVVLSWAAPAGGCAPTSYVIQAGSSPGASDLANFSTGSTTPSFTATGVGSGTYFVRIISANSGGVSAPSNEAAFVVGSCGTVPNPPTNLRASIGGSTLALAWDAPAGGCAPASYVLQAGSSSGASNLANVSVAGTSLTAVGVANGTYYIRVVAVNAVGQSSPSNEVVATLPPTPATIIAGFQLFDPATQAGVTTECRLRAPNNSSPVTCTLQSTSIPLGANAITSYTWSVQYTHGTVKTLSATQASPSFSFSDVCDSPDGVNGGTDTGVAQPLVVTLTITDNLGATATATSGSGSQPPLFVRLFNCGK
jgi:fibronectin type III domain protein